MRKPDIGLVLSGGGARGAYQLGVMAALKKYKLYDRIQAIAGGSIGSFSAVMYLLDNLTECYKIWKNMDANMVLDYKNDLKDKIPVKEKGLFSRNALMSYIYQQFDLENLLKIDKPVYACCSMVNKKGLKKTYTAKYFLLNYKPQDYICKVLLGSSAIPYIFDAVEIDGDMFVDCLKTDNEPTKPLEQYDLDMMFVVPLTASHKPEKYNNYHIPIIDFIAEELMDAPTINMIEFNPLRSDYYINLGYYVGCTLLKYLNEKKAFKGEKYWQDLPKYISLKSIGIKLTPQKMLSFDEILYDIKYGEK